MTGRTHGRDGLAPFEPNEPEGLQALAQDMLAADVEQEERFLARLEQMEVGPAGRHRRRQISAVVVACLVVGTAAAAAVGIVGRGEPGHGATGTGRPDEQQNAQPPLPIEPAGLGGSTELPMEEPVEPEPATVLVHPERVKTPQVHAQDQEPAPPEIDARAEQAPPTLPEDLRLLAQIELQRGSGTPPGVRLDLLHVFLERFPDSAHAGEVRALTVEALADAGRNEDALLAVEQYLRLHPDDSRRQQVRWLEATVARDRLQDCERALPAYEELAGGDGPWREAAEQYVEGCSP